MPSEKLWQAKPHTIAKIQLLGAYLKAWLSILGTTKSRQRLVYVDGFCGPGKYTNYPKGSPLAAIEAANSVLSTHHERWKAGEVCCAFIDADADSIRHLQQEVEKTPASVNIRTYFVPANFEEGMRQVRELLPEPFTQGSPIFVFIDPFGVGGVPFKVVRGILTLPCAEVLINLDADGIDRVFHAGEDAGADRILTEVFGNSTWKTELNQGGTIEQRCQRVLALYKDCLRSIPGVKYNFSFEMRSQNSRLNYFLVFAGRNRLGLEKMKEAMRTIDQAGEYCFSDAEVGQTRMFQKDQNAEAKSFAQKCFARYRGQTVGYNDMYDFALNETSYLNPKRLLRFLEESGYLAEVILKPGRSRRKGQFDEDTVDAVKFAMQRKQTKLFE